ncbi:MAG TPA: heparin lyase I family protein [Pseudonocardia sp.]|nr:heparin lyase I family protein [Pseudonocardia sp.]
MSAACRARVLVGAVGLAVVGTVLPAAAHAAPVTPPDPARCEPVQGGGWQGVREPAAELGGPGTGPGQLWEHLVALILETVRGLLGGATGSGGPDVGVEQRRSGPAPQPIPLDGHTGSDGRNPEDEPVGEPDRGSTDQGDREADDGEADDGETGDRGTGDTDDTGEAGDRAATEVRGDGADRLGPASPTSGCAGVGAGPASPVVPADAVEVFGSDFETGLGEWDTCQNAFMNGSCDGIDGAGHAVSLVEDARAGQRAARFVVQAGDVPDFGGGERSEVAAHGDEMLTHEGDERWYQVSIKFGETFENPVDGDWFIVMQWHSGHGSPPLAIEVSPEGEVCVGGEGGEERVIGPVRRGEWTDYVFHVGFSGGDGFAAAWENGVQTVQRHTRATMSSAENYFKLGIYRGNDDSSTAEVLFDDFSVFAPSGEAPRTAVSEEDGGDGEDGGN